MAKRSLLSERPTYFIALMHGSCLSCFKKCSTHG